MSAAVTTNWPGSNIARAVLSDTPPDGRHARRIIAAALAHQGFRITGAIGKPIRPRVYLVAVEPIPA